MGVSLAPQFEASGQDGVVVPPGGVEGGHDEGGGDEGVNGGGVFRLQISQIPARMLQKLVTFKAVNLQIAKY